MGSVRLTAADQTLVWAAMTLVSPWEGAADRKMYQDILRDVLPHVNRGNTYVARVADAVRSLIEKDPAGQFRLRCALGDLARCRASLGYDAFDAQAGDRKTG